MVLLPLFGDRKPVALARGFDARFSPDGSWVACTSTESGRNEIFVHSLPGAAAAGKFQISIDGGTAPRWRDDGKELYFLSDRKLMAVTVTASATSFRAGKPVALFQVPGQAPTFAPDRDGRRFLFLMPAARDAPRPLTVVLNWESRLRKP